MVFSFSFFLFILNFFLLFGQPSDQLWPGRPLVKFTKSSQLTHCSGNNKKTATYSKEVNKREGKKGKIGACSFGTRSL